MNCRKKNCYIKHVFKKVYIVYTLLQQLLQRIVIPFENTE